MILSSINSPTTGICMIKTSKDRIRDVIFENHAFHFIAYHTNNTSNCIVHYIVFLNKPKGWLCFTFLHDSCMPTLSSSIPYVWLLQIYQPISHYAVIWHAILLCDWFVYSLLSLWKIRKDDLRQVWVDSFKSTNHLPYYIMCMAFNIFQVYLYFTIYRRTFFY